VPILHHLGSVSDVSRAALDGSSICTARLSSFRYENAIMALINIAAFERRQRDRYYPVTSGVNDGRQ
jgi:hypothetical protein